LQAEPTTTSAPDVRALQPDSATRLATNYFTLAKALKTAGYATGHFGKWHLGREPFGPLQQGFDVDVPHYCGPGPAGGYLGPWTFPRELDFVGRPGEHVEDRMAQEAIKFIKANKEQPFFLNYWAFSVHAPFNAKPELVEKYRQKAARFDNTTSQRNPVYAAMVQSLDENIGRLLDALEELKLADNTIIIFFSDNGGVNWAAMKDDPVYAQKGFMNGFRDVPITSNAPLRGGKATLYEGGAREPCVFVWPGKVQPGSASEALLSSVDFYPTILEMVGLKPRASQKFDGVSQVSALLGQAASRDTVFCYFPHLIPVVGCFPGTWVRRGDWKLIRFHCDNEDQSDRFELYNLKADIGETNNLAAKMPEKVKELNLLMNGFFQETKAYVPQPNPNYRCSANKSEGK
jgi:arylsulfatase A-like enzyme